MPVDFRRTTCFRQFDFVRSGKIEVTHSACVPLRTPIVLVVTVLLGFVAQAQTARRIKPVPNPAPRAPPVLPNPPTPVIDIAEAGVTRCVPVFDRMSKQVLTRAYKVESDASRTDSSRHVFKTIAALNSPENQPSDGVAALIAAPVQDGCDGVSVQVFPLAGDCPSAAKVLLQSGSAMTPLLNTRMFTDSAGHRVILLPGFANTCVAVSVDTTYGSP